jgi:hypothetical protein
MVTATFGPMVLSIQAMLAAPTDLEFNTVRVFITLAAAFRPIANGLSAALLCPIG